LGFHDPPFRKLGNLKIEFADRLTVIAGHNGIGKSTILGLVANTFGLTDPQWPKSYFVEPFYANIERIVYLAISEIAARTDPNADPTVVAQKGDRIIKKRCAMTPRSKWMRVRVGFRGDGS
jgi:predicted ATP-dependent endonuclease of OLD family